MTHKNIIFAQGIADAWMTIAVATLIFGVALFIILMAVSLFKGEL